MAALAMAVLALLLAVAGAAAAFAALGARSLFMTCIASAASAAAIAAALAALGADTAALSLALFGVGFAPLLLMAGVLLSTRTIKPGRARAPLAAITAAVFSGAILATALPEQAIESGALEPHVGDLGPWLAALVFVAAVVCVGLLGYGERGAFEKPGRGP